MNNMDHTERLAFRILVGSLVMVFLGMGLAHLWVSRLSHGWNAQVITLTGRALEGAWTVEPVSGYNYFWKKFQPVDEIVVQKGRPVVLRVTSSDVVHSFAIPSLPAFRRPADIKPGEYHEFRFTPEEEDELVFLCWQVCSPQHGKMKGRIVVQ